MRSAVNAGWRSAMKPKRIAIGVLGEWAWRHSERAGDEPVRVTPSRARKWLIAGGGQGRGIPRTSCSVRHVGNY
jgi:hypothetical protein